MDVLRDVHTVEAGMLVFSFEEVGGSPQIEALVLPDFVHDLDELKRQHVLS